jgi:hypothetical protein
MFAGAPDHGQRTVIPRTHEEALGLAAGTTSTVEFQARFGISSAASAASSMGRPSNNPLDPTAHRMSLIEISSPSHSDPNLDNQPSHHMSSLSTTQLMATSRGSPALECQGLKPPLPTTPKPVFSRHPSLLKKQSASNSLPFHTTNVKPATTNFLDEVERADLVRKSRKLARLFGETPNAEVVVNQAGLLPTALAHRKQSEPDARLSLRRRDPHGLDGVNAFSRRYSLPVRVDDVPSMDFSAVDVDEYGNLGPKLCSNRPSSSLEDQSNSCHQASPIRSPSPVSFIELSDDGSSTSIATRTTVSSSYRSKPSSIDLLENERRRKRERLAKLYRFLGSQVPINLVMGTNDGIAASLPRTQQDTLGFDETNNRRSTLLSRRRSSSAIPSASTWSDDVERLKADLGDREKAIIVRRAQKMEKVSTHSCLWI